MKYENHEIAFAMPALLVLAGGILMYTSVSLHWLEEFKCLNQSHCTDWKHLNVLIRFIDLAGGI